MELYSNLYKTFMRKLFRTFAAAALLLASGMAGAQQMPPIPVDPEVRIGKLDNGLTYYIRHNDFNKQRADFYIAQKVGSILEEDNQRGLAHFLEHMCFNGTENFEGNSMISYLESIGVKFGANLNAYTSVDETVYNISDVPVVRETIIDSCLLILHDWADGLTLDPKEIDKERGVIHEEWRTRTGAMMRMYEKSFPEIYPDSKYAYRLPIGTMEVVDNFPYQVLRDYYEKWYRPDQQGILVVGDIDVDAVEKKIKDIFSVIEMPENPAEREYFPVPDNKEPIVSIQKDKEQPYYMVYVYNKHEAVPNEAKGTLDYLMYNYLQNMVVNMLNNRISEIQMKPECPFIEAGGYDASFILAKTKDAFSTVAVCDQDGIDESLAILIREVERIKKFGFTASEYDRARSEYLSQLEKVYNNRNSMKNGELIEQYVRHFIDNEPIPSIEQEYQIMSQTVNMIPVEAANQIVPAFVSDSNLVVTVYCPDKEDKHIPTKEEILKVINDTKAENIEAYVDTTPTEPLMTEENMPKGGQILSEQDGPFGSKLLKLSNGIKVYLLDTDYKDDEIRMNAVSWGGKTLVDTKDMLDAEFATTLVQYGGTGNFSAVELQKVLSGKQASVTPSISQLQETLSGNSTVKDFETLMQLTYLQFTTVHKDDDAIASLLKSQKAALANAEANPMTSFQDTLLYVLYGNNPRNIGRVKAEMIDKVNYDNAIALYKERFANPADFTFFFVGKLDGENIRPMIAKYLGGLETTKKMEKFNKKNYVEIQKGRIEKTFTRQMETPKTTVIELYTGKTKYSYKAELAAGIIGDLLDMDYTEHIRENLGGSYGVGVSVALSDQPEGSYAAQIYFDTDPERCDTIISIVRARIDNFIENGPDMDDFAKVKEHMVKTYTDSAKENSYWASVLRTQVINGIDAHTDYLAILESIDAAYLEKIAKIIFNEKGKKQVIMNGEK